MTIDDHMVELVARRLCWKNGMDPDLTLGGDGQNFLWHEYTDQAVAAIEVCRSVLEEQFRNADSRLQSDVNEYKAIASKAIREQVFIRLDERRRCVRVADKIAARFDEGSSERLIAEEIAAELSGDNG